MTKEEFVKRILSNPENTVFVNEEQVLNAIYCFQKAGMLPPKSLDTVTSKKGLIAGYTSMFEWDDE